MATLQIEKRELGLSKGTLNKHRQKGQIPAVVYGKDLDNSVSVWINQIDFMKIYQDSGKIMEMKLDSGVEMVNAKVLDRGPMGRLMHVNFHKLVRGQKTQVKIPLNAEGEAKGVKDGGILSWSNDKLVVEGVPKDIPESVTFDVSEMEIGSVLHAKDIKLPAGITLVDEADMDIVSVQAPSKAEPEEEAAAEGDADAAAEGGAEAPAAEAAPAEGESKE